MFHKYPSTIRFHRTTNEKRHLETITADSSQQVSFLMEQQYNKRRQVSDQFPLTRLALLLASWLSWQDLAKFFLHLGNHGTYRNPTIPLDPWSNHENRTAQRE